MTASYCKSISNLAFICFFKGKKMEKKPLEKLINQNPVLKNISSQKEVFWINPFYSSFESANKKISLNKNDIKDAQQRLIRFAPYISKVFSETSKTKGIIESPIIKIPKLQTNLEKNFGTNINANLLLKCDSHLAVSGSIKARGGIYEVLKHAEKLALENKMIGPEMDYSVFDSKNFKNFFSNYSIAVGSTGNLGLSIGIMGARLGFKVYVHMSSDAKQWKKDLLKTKGVEVIEYESDYGKAVEEGRKQAQSDPKMHFVDDENSKDLFLGYAVAASGLEKQLDELNIKIDENHPLFVYLPCGVGGGPGGITFGLKQIFKDNVHCFFAEPVSSPCMLLGLMTGLHNKINVYDFGLNNKTEADGLAVASPSAFVGKTLKELISGIFTVKDNNLFKLLAITKDSENLFLEPSALAGMPGPFRLLSSDSAKTYIKNQNLENKMKNSTHVIWATGGSMVPDSIMSEYYKKGDALKYT
jgi:D-serine dehydratase